jgi:hypothetical protein
MNMRGLIFLTLFIFFSQLVFGQLKNKPLLEKPNISTSVTVGATTGNLYSGTYFAPNINQTINSKLSLNYGAVFSNGSSNVMLSDSYGYSYITPSSSNTFYVDGTYRVNDRITVKSTVVVNKSNFDSPGQDMQNFNSNSYMMGIEYKLSENVRIQAEVGMGQGLNPYSNIINPYDQRPFNYGIKPFYSSLLGY